MGIAGTEPLTALLLTSAGLLYLGLLLLCARWFARRPEDAACVMMAVAPLEVISFYKGITLKPFLLLFPAVIAGLGWRYRRTALDKQWTVSEWDWLIAACWGWTVFSCLFAVDAVRGFRMAVQLAIVFVIAVATARLVSDRDKIQRYLTFLRWSALTVCAYALWQAAGYFLGFPSQQLLALARLNPTLPRMLVEPGAIVFSGSMSVVRVSSTFFDWNVFSAYLVMLIPLFLAVVWRYSLVGRLPQTMFWGLLFLVAAWLLTFSRSGWLGGVTAVLMLAGFGLPVRWLLRRYILVIGAVILVCLIAQVDPFTLLIQRVGQSLTGERSIQEHGKYGLAALDMLYEHPLTGVGIHNYATVYQRIYDPNIPGATAHSGFLSIFAEMGFVGGVIYVLTFLYVLDRLWKAQRGHAVNDPDGIFLRSLFAAVVGLGVCNLFYHFWTQLFLWCFLGFCVAVARVMLHEEDDEQKTPDYSP